MPPAGSILGVDALVTAVRALALVAALQAAGLSLFLAWHRTALGERAPALVALARSMALAAIFLVLAHQALEAARMAGEWSGVLDGPMQRIDWRASPGISALTAAAALLVEYAGLSLGGRLGRTLAVLGALGVACSFLLTGHTSDDAVPVWTRGLLAAHVTLVSYWVGSVVALTRLTRVVDTASVAEISSAFSALAGWLVPAILPIGVGIAIGLLPSLAALRSVYGALLITKVVGFTLLIGLASYNRWRAVPALQRTPEVALAQFRLSLRAEYCLLAGVITTTAVMTSLFSWH